MATIASVLAVAVALGADAFSIALGLGLSGAERRFRIRFVLVVGLLHVVMPLIGLVVGAVVGQFLGKWAAIAGALVLAFIGIQMLHKGLERGKEEVMPFDLSRLNRKESWLKGLSSEWGAVLVLGISVSIDALTVGFGLGTVQVPIPVTVATMGTVAGLMTALGWLGSRYLSAVVGQRAQVLGGLILTLLAIKMLL